MCTCTNACALFQFWEIMTTGVMPRHSSARSCGKSTADLFAWDHSSWTQVQICILLKPEKLARFVKNLRKRANNDMILTEIAVFFFIDSTPFQLKYWTHPKENHYDWRGVAPREKYKANLLKVRIWINSSATDNAIMPWSKISLLFFAKWKIAVGHPTMRIECQSHRGASAVASSNPQVRSSHYLSSQSI